MPFYVIFVQLPQRFQVVNFTSAERAGILLLPATLMTPVGAMVAGLAAKKVPIEFVLIVSATLVCLGVGLLGSLPTHSTLWPGTYGYEVITGLGLGLASPPYFMLIATSIAEKDMSVGTGALSMSCPWKKSCEAYTNFLSNDRHGANTRRLRSCCHMLSHPP
jgi:cyanate permease